MTLTKVATYRIPATHPFDLTIARGSVVDFAHPSNPRRAAIVNAANEGCLGGGGVDGAVGRAGGPSLYEDRERLPEAEPGVRCPTGRAAMTGPGSYGDLEVPYVIHAVGPSYSNYEDEMARGDRLLASAYTASLECGRAAGLEAIAFCLLSAGLFRGTRTVEEVSEIGLRAIRRFEGYEELKEVCVCGFTPEELRTLVAIANEIGPNEVEQNLEKDTNAETGSSGDGSEKKSEQVKGEKVDENGGKQEGHEEREKDEDAREEWEIRRDELKSAGDAHFRSKSYALAIQSYADALQLDPTNHVILSNKSAAHLANNEKSKALHDAKRCTQHAGTWAKGHTRLGAAMASLGRYNEAAGVYSKVLNELDADNAVAKKGLEDCRARQKRAREEKEKEARRVQMELDMQKAEAEKERRKKEEEKNSAEGMGNEDDDLLEGFFDEVEKVSEKRKPTKSEDSKSQTEPKRIKTQMSDLGTSASQIDRLLQVNYEWKNLNPFHVLDMPHDVDDESVISARYRALSLLVHPDKCPGDPARAKDAFEQVRKAMVQMNDADKRRHVRALIEQGRKQGKRDWEAAKSKGGNGLMSSKKEEEMLAQARSRATMKIFAEIEQKRRNIDRRKRDFEQRERAQEDEEKAKEKGEREHDRRWREGERVDKRVGNWRDFQGGGGRGKKGRLN